MVGFLKIMVPILLIVFLLMGVWVSVLHFPWEWMTYVAMGLEVFLAMLILPFEFQSQHVTGINHFGFINL
ncbi:putative membrane protein, partial [Acinetobacter pittii]